MKLNPTKCGLIVLAAAATSVAVAADLHVGPNQRYTTLDSVPFWSLKPGDNVLIHYKPGGYHETFQLMMSGTVDKHISVRGVPDPVTGKRPIIDGKDAKIGRSIYYGYYWQSLYTYGGIIISPPRGFTWGDAPSYIDIEGLELCNFNQTSTMTNLYGQRQQFDKFCAAIYGERVRHLTVKNCKIHNDGLGVFVNSKYAAAGVSKDILIENNTFALNGNPGSVTEHHIYTECDGITIQFNTFGPMVKGSYGSVIKDRSAGTVIRYNSMQVAQFAVGVYLMGPQGGYGYIDTLPNFTKSYFYGNVMYNPPTGGNAFVFFGGDSGSARTGKLYSYHNTFINHADGVGTKKRLGTILYRLNSPTELLGAPVQTQVDSRNNAFYCLSETKGVAAAEMSLVYGAGNPSVNFGRDFKSRTVNLYMAPRGWTGDKPTFTGVENLFPPDPCDDAGLVDASLSAQAMNTAAFLKIVSPATLVGLIDPNELVRRIDLNLFWRCIDLNILATMIDPNLVVGVIDPNVLCGVIDPNDLVGALRPGDLVGVVDPNDLVGLIDPNDLVGVIDPNERPSAWTSLGAPSILIGNAGPLSPELPAELLPTMEYRASGRWTSNWKTRTARGPLSIGALEPQR